MPRAFALVTVCLGLLVGSAHSIRADSAVVFNEIMYHPLTNESQLEWVELQNQMAVDIDMSRWRLDGGIDFAFPEGTIIRAGGYLVIGSSPATLQSTTGLTNALGPFANRLSNAGERLRLRNNDGRIIDEVSYGVEGDWPVAPDGTGPSLARRRANLRGSDPRSWSASAQLGGTPGAENFSSGPPTALSNAAVTFTNQWRFNDAGSEPDVTWRTATYNDANWPRGRGLFFHGDGALPGLKTTPLAPGRTTYYFRTDFVITGGVERVQLLLRPIIDDGAVGYLNGSEIFRVNMPGGPVAASTLALGTIDNATIGDRIYIPTEQLLTGTNVLAVEVHQAPLFSAYSHAISNSAPLAYWRLGETTGAAVDSAPAGGAQNGTYAGFAALNLGQAGPCPSDSVNGQLLTGMEADNPAPRFAGNADGGNDVIRIPDAGVFNFANTRTFTLEAWVNGAAGQEAGAAIIAKGTGGGGEQFAIDVFGTYRFFAWDGGAPNTAFVASAPIGPDGTWQHFVAVLDQPAGRMKLYVNGVERATATPRPTLVNSTHEVSIGARKNSGSANYDLNFDGRIDEVAIYNRALTPAEILAHYQAAFAHNVAAGADTNDAAFGLELVVAETVAEPEPPRIVFNELASATNSGFWLELINIGRDDVDLRDWTIARFGGATNREYILPSQLLTPGSLLQLGTAQLGFGVDSGDRLALYPPQRTNVTDAIVAKKDPRARYPDGTGQWWFLQQLTPSASNRFAFRDELVINEIMFHQRELAPEPAIYSPTNLLLTISNLWKYHAESVDLGTDWRAPAYNDSAWTASNAVFYAPTNPFVLPAPKNTFLPLTNSAGDRIVTYYFRTQFQFSGETNNLRIALRPIVDDGAIFYLNGNEVYRHNMPATNILYGTFANVNVGVPGFSGPVLIPFTNLLQGVNTVAVEVHQFSVPNTDFDFGTELFVFYELRPALPFRDSPESWVEIYNRSSNTVDLTGWRIDEGVDYRFAAGQSLAPNSYLVIARDVPYMQSLYAGLRVLGPFTNRLSQDTDYIALKDPNNNVADEVRYFSGGRWHEYADGGSSSLELRDPWADNIRPEAWAASDERGKGQWETFTWRGLAAPGQIGEPTLWREFAMCLLDGAGEVLIDDVSVVETPAATPRQLINNGSFDNGTSRWRFLGNHSRSRVTTEPGNSGNNVLHLVASGPGEYQGNQIETTLAANTAIVDGREYEISYRARWLAGKRRLNTRLYFNRLSRTFDLATPLRTGTPGTRNSQFVENLGPTCSELKHEPVVPNPNEPARVSVNGSDPHGVENLSLNYSVDGGQWRTLSMTNRALEYSAIIPGQPAGSIVQFYITAVDRLGAASVYPAGGTNSRALYVVQDGQAAPAPAHNFRIIMTEADAVYMHTGTNTLSNELLGCTVVSDQREVFYDAGVRLKGSFVGRNVARVGFHVTFNSDELFRGVHRVVSVDRSQHTGIGGIGEIIVKHIGNHAGGIPGMYDDLARCIAPLPSHTGQSQLRLTGFDNDYLDAQWANGAEGPMFEMEVLRWNASTVDNNPESPKQVGNESGGTGYANLEVQNYGDNKESYRWIFLQNNRRTADDYSRVIAVAKTLSLSGIALTTQAVQVLDVDEWLRVMAYQELIGTADAYYTGANIHNFRLYARPEDQKVLYLPWDWDSAFQASAGAPITGSGNIAKLVEAPGNRRAYLNHMFDIITRTFNTAYMGQWTRHYGTIGGQDTSSILNYITARSAFALTQLPTTTQFSITSNNGTDFGTSNSTVNISGAAPIRVRKIEVNGVAYPVTWTSTTAWTVIIPLYAGTNFLAVQGIDNYGNRITNAFDSITITNTGLPALLPVTINEWMADNAAPFGFPDPADGLYQDWFELFNPNTNAVNLGGSYLTDNLSQATKWQIPAGTVIAPRGFLLVWADDQPEQNGLSGDLHAGFQLNNSGDAIALFNVSGVAQHIVRFGPQVENVSQGLFPDGYTNAFHSMTNWTPRSPNTLAGPLAISGISINGDRITLIWSSVPGRMYRVDYKNDLLDPEWIPVNSIRAISTVASGTEALPANLRHRFYRITRVD